MAVVVGIAGFRGHLSRNPPIEIFPDMNRQLKLRPQQPNDFFANGISSQLPPAGTIARRAPIRTVSGPVYPYEDAPVNTGRITGTTNFVETNPLPITAKLLQRGHERFDIYCAPCHGALGDGNGITKKLGLMPAVANLQDKRIVEMTDGEIFNTVTHGKEFDGRVWADSAGGRSLGHHRLFARAATKPVGFGGRFAARPTRRTAKMKNTICEKVAQGVCLPEQPGQAGRLC